MTLAELLVKIGIEGADKVQTALKNIAADGAKAEKSTDGLTSALGKFSSIPGPLGDVASKLSGIQSAASDAKEGVGLAESALTKMGGSASLLVPALAAVGVGLLALAGIGATLQFAGQIDDLQDLGDKLGYSATKTAIFSQQLQSAGTSIETYTAAQQKVAIAVSKTGDEGSKASEALSRLGVSFKESSNVSDIAAQAAANYQTKLKEGTLTSQDMADIQLVLGKNFREAIIAIDEASIAQERLNYFTSIGVGISQDSVNASKQLEAAQNNMSFVMKTIGSILAADVVPTFATLIEQFTNSYTEGGLLAAAVNVIRVAFQAVLIPIKAVALAFISVDTTVQMMGKTIGAVMAAIGSGSTEPLRALAEDLDRIALKGAKLMGEIKFDGFSSTAVKKEEIETGVKAGPVIDDASAKAAAKAAAKAEEQAADRVRAKAAADLLQAKNQQHAIEQKIADSVLQQTISDFESVKFNRELEAILLRRTDLSEKEKNTVRQKLNDQRDEATSAELLTKSKKSMLEEMDKQIDRLLVLGDADLVRVKLAEKLNKAIDDYKNNAKSILPGALETLEAQKAQVLAQYDQNKAVADQKKMAELVTKEYEKQSDLVAQIIQRNREAISSAQNDFANRNKSKKEREGETLRDKINGPLQASVSTAETEIAQKQQKGIKTDADTAYIEARRQRIEELKQSIAEGNLAVNTLLAARDAAEVSINEGITRGITRSLDQIPTLAEGIANVMNTTTKGLEDGLFNLFTKGEFDIKSFFSLLMNELVKLFIQLTIIKPMLDYLKSSFGGGLFGMLGGSAAGTATTFSGAAVTGNFAAMGGAYDSGVKMYASGDVFNSPTAFNSSKGLGILGEAGPEAIMPLKRGMDGKLGIANVGGTSQGGLVLNGGINVTVQGGNTNSETGDIVSKKVLEMMKGVARQEIMGAKRVGGSLNPV